MKSLNMRENQTKGFLITFCGLDGCGKTTMINKLNEELSQKYSVFLTKQPTAAVRQSEIFRTYMDSPDHSKYDYRSLSLLAASDRIQHSTKTIEPLLSKGNFVLSDRYYYSSLAYQGAELGFEAVAKLNLENPDIRMPDICIFLDLSPEKSLERIGKRADVPTEIYENYEYLEKTRKMFYGVFDRLRERGEHIEIIDAAGSAEEIASSILEKILPLFS